MSLIIRLKQLIDFYVKHSRATLKYILVSATALLLLSVSGIHFLAHLGMPEAEVLLASMYRDGWAIYPKDVNKAKQLYLSASKKNYPQAQCDLGWIYEKEKNYRYAIYLYKAAALQNLIECQYNLATMYDRGFGVVKDHSKAFILYKFVADKNYSPAQFSVGYDYINGVGTEKNINLGLTYLKKAAENNNKNAQGYLAWLYFSNEVISQDISSSRKWAEIAKKNGEQNMEYLLDQLSTIQKD